MKELAKSIGSFSWALSLFGARQMGEMINPETWRHPDGAARSLDAVAGSVGDRLGDTLGRAFEAGDRLQRGMVDAAFSALGPVDPQRMLNLGADVARRAVSAAFGDCGCGGEAEGEAQGGWGAMPPVPPEGAREQR